MVLIDDDPDYLSVAPDGIFRSRTATRTRSPASGSPRPRSSRAPRSWSSCTTRPTSIAAFAEAAREQAGLPDEPTGAEDLFEAAGIAPDETVGVGVGGQCDRRYAGGADDWARGTGRRAEPANARTPRAACTTWR